MTTTRLEDIVITHPITHQVINGNEVTDIIEAAMLEVYNTEWEASKHTKDNPYPAKVAVKKFIEGTGPKPEYLSQATADMLISMHISMENIKLVMDKLKNDDHYILDLIAALMTHEDYDVYDARDEIYRLFSYYHIGSDKTSEPYPQVLLTNPVYGELMAQLPGMNITDLSIYYAFNKQRLGAIEILTDNTNYNFSWTPKRAVDTVFVANGGQLSAFIKEFNVTSALIEQLHDDHQAHLSSTGSNTGDIIATLATSVIASNPTAIETIIGSITGGASSTAAMIANAVSSTAEAAVQPGVAGSSDSHFIIRNVALVALALASLGTVALAVRNRSHLKSCIGRFFLLGNYDQAGSNRRQVFAELDDDKGEETEMAVIDGLSASSDSSDSEDEAKRPSITR